jgi:hypothetical protein
MKFRIFVFMVVIVNLEAFAQSKKEQILILQNKIDSLSTELKNERLNNQIQIEQNIFKIDSLLIAFEKKNARFQYFLKQYETSNDSLKLELETQRNENILLKEKLSELSLEKNEITNDSDTNTRNQFLSLKQIVTKICTNELARNKILSHITNRYNEHLQITDSLSSLPENEIGGSEDLSMEIVYSNENFLAYQVTVDGYYGGAHPEQWDEQYLFDLHSGSTLNLESLILPEKKVELLSILNKKLKQEAPEVVKCSGDNDNISLKFTQEDFKSIQIQKDGIVLEYWLSYAARACNPYVFIDKKVVSMYFNETLFE